ncbi:MAG: hypothetical protein ACW99A_23560 [Candidatus Kariarchaeaceae archaeon]|jgi:hypothetical protein
MLNRRSFLKSVPTPLLGFLGITPIVSSAIADVPEMVDGLFHTISRNGLIHTWRNKYGELHNPNGPAYIYYYKNGKIYYKQYFINGEYHREDGPAYICYHKNGQIGLELYYLNGKLKNII